MSLPKQARVQRIAGQPVLRCIAHADAGGHHGSNQISVDSRSFRAWPLRREVPWIEDGQANPGEIGHVPRGKGGAARQRYRCDLCIELADRPACRRAAAMPA